MRQTMRNNRWTTLVAFLLVAPLLAGCFGDDAPEVTDDGPGQGVEVRDGGKGGGSTIRGAADHEGSLKDPSAHYHHYWGNPAIDSVTIFDGGIPFQNFDTKWISRNTLAWAEFDLETDFNDVADPRRDDPISKETGIADTVFAGTERITVHFPDTFPPNVDMMIFHYKASNTPLYLPEEGIPVYPGDVVEIKLTETGMSDPPHQFTVSRWKFRLFAQNPLCAEGSLNLQGMQCPPAYIRDPGRDPQNGDTTFMWGARGSGLQMIAHNGGERQLDPPHPNFWVGGSETIPLGDASDEVDGMSIQTPLVRERLHSLTDIRMPPNNIVPLGTEHVEVRLTWTNNAPTDGVGGEFQLILYYHGADGIEYKRAPLDTKEGDTYVYRIFDENSVMVDPPYESNSFWRFKLVPATVINGETRYYTGAFEGEWRMEFFAHKIPGFILE